MPPHLRRRVQPRRQSVRAAARGIRFLALCEQARPAQATLVPDGDGQLTSDHGFDFVRDAGALLPLVASPKSLGCRVSLFADAGADVEAAAATGADRIELYTGPYAKPSRGDAGDAIAACSTTPRRAGRRARGQCRHDSTRPTSRLSATRARCGSLHRPCLDRRGPVRRLAGTVRRYLALCAGTDGRGALAAHAQGRSPALHRHFPHRAALQAHEPDLRQAFVLRRRDHARDRLVVATRWRRSEHRLLRHRDHRFRGHPPAHVGAHGLVVPVGLPRGVYPEVIGSAATTTSGVGWGGRGRWSATATAR